MSLSDSGFEKIISNITKLRQEINNYSNEHKQKLKHQIDNIFKNLDAKKEEKLNSIIQRLIKRNPQNSQVTSLKLESTNVYNPLQKLSGENQTKINYGLVSTYQQTNIPKLPETINSVVSKNDSVVSKNDLKKFVDKQLKTVGPQISPTTLPPTTLPPTIPLPRPPTRPPPRPPTTPTTIPLPRPTRPPPTPPRPPPTTPPNSGLNKQKEYIIINNIEKWPSFTKQQKQEFISAIKQKKGPPGTNDMEKSLDELNILWYNYLMKINKETIEKKIATSRKAETTAKVEPSTTMSNHNTEIGRVIEAVEGSKKRGLHFGGHKKTLKRYKKHRTRKNRNQKYRKSKKR